MSRAVTLTGAAVKVLINNAAIGQIQSVNYTVDTGDYEIYGVDSFIPQEIAPGRYQITGNMSGVKVINDGGLQSRGIRDTFKNILSGNYISIRITDRVSGEEIMFIPQAKVISEQISMQAKGVVKFSFNFRGTIGLQPLDRV